MIMLSISDIAFWFFIIFVVGAVLGHISAFYLTHKAHVWRKARAEKITHTHD